MLVPQGAGAHSRNCRLPGITPLRRRPCRTGREFASRIQRMSPQMWTDPERFFRDRSELAAQAAALARLLAPDEKPTHRVKVEVMKGRTRLEGGTPTINGRRVTVQRRRQAFTISVGK